MTIYLGLDSATEYLSLALWSPDTGILTYRSPHLGRTHTHRIVPELEALFHEAGCVPRNLSGIGVGIGPGSYTGLRVGLATAKGLARGLNIPLAGCDTLEALAASDLAEGETVYATLDARRGNVYVGIYRLENGVVATLRSPKKIAKDGLKTSASSLRIIEARAPNAGHIARRARAGRTAEALYL
ncbi:MAG: tRNA (adenosine(37)-N6)-threonylcarbamoyltransferase complex dimerization subunit type 1 TsaB [Truepera sp.]|nr:tRNA (adenosine(37)-N6)-threonylcarbamoyltransferase complex dimerization subunit type 1 TsaB [Truepera sp.]